MKSNTLYIFTLIVIAASGLARCHAEETFITIQRVNGNRITYTITAGGGRGRGAMGAGAGAQQNPGDAPAGGGRGFGGRGRGRRFGGGGEGPGRGFGGGRFGAGAPDAAGRGRGRGGFPSGGQALTATIPSTAKITSAMRERRTFEFRAGVELGGGMRNPVFTRMQKPLSARLVTDGNRITQLNVITEDTDINQLNTSSTGQTVIAVKPKRPPSK